MIVVGITGGIGSGKSTASKFLKSSGYKVLDADVQAKRLLQKDGESYLEILNKWGEEILDNFGEIDRKKLADIVFNNQDDMKALNELTHIKVEKAFKEAIAELRSSEHIVFLDVPLLFEAGVDKLCDYVWLIYAKRDVRIERVMKRDGVSDREVLSRMANQMPEEKKKKLSSEIIDNSKGEKELFAQLKALLKKYEEVV